MGTHNLVHKEYPPRQAIITQEATEGNVVSPIGIEDPGKRPTPNAQLPMPIDTPDRVSTLGVSNSHFKKEIQPLPEANAFHHE